MTKPHWNDYFLWLADLVSLRSPDPSTKHGCVLVDSQKRVLSTGYNGPVQGLEDWLVPLERPDKYDWFIHAEENALIFAKMDLSGATAYITGHPCPACLRHLLQAGVRLIIHAGRKSHSIGEKEQLVVSQMCESLGAQIIGPEDFE